MSSPATDPFGAVPAEVRPYLTELVHRTRAVFGPRLTGVVAVGSLALGDYRHGRSDVDVTVVVEEPSPAEALRELAGVLSHERLPCPSTGLELVVYPAGIARTPSGAAGWLLDLNTGARLPARAAFDTADGPSFWYVIDRSVAHQDGIALYGPPAPEVIAAPRPAELFDAIRASVREHGDGAGHLADNRVLNGCRSVAYGRTGRWFAKRGAAARIAEAEEEFRPLIEAAVRSFERPRGAALPLPGPQVRAFLTWVRQRVEEYAAAAGA
ncbi:aminoglycoside adenylyltransferase domain-containing protein [Streptomyces sp. CRN 30]|uniref:aminoglycoside adenylyltransferase domain-containing protein n=1 Tax=Streptomyces sp. CRN 30 TaxID=3075613 RepID=UPI002A80A314|nr:aminoglycoside adenylyltransferase domain-containing protein [Streptomyces sp. CRN 30]